MGSASSRPASHRRRLSRPNGPKWTIASLLVCGGSPSTAARNEMEDDSSNMLVDSSIQGESTIVSGLRTPVYESDLISSTGAETEASIQTSLVQNDDSNTCGDYIYRSNDIWSEFMQHPNSAHSEEELEESCSDQMSVENHASEVSTSYNHGPVRLPIHEHVNFSDTEEEEEEEEEEEQMGMVSILSSSPPESTYRIRRENSRTLFWDAFSRRNSIRRRHRGDSHTSISASDGLGSHDRFLFDFDLSADSSDDDQGNRIHSSNIQRLQSQSEFWERLYANRRRRSSNHGTGTCPSGIHHDGTCSCDSTSGGEEDTRASVSRIVMLAEALFEVLDEIHRQPVSLSLSVISLPAPGCVVDSFPTKNHRKLNDAQNGEDTPQCYICLDEYEDGDEIRVLPCRHEYHMGCVDKWLKEIHGVCPLCRGDVCEGLSERPISSSL